MNIKSLEVKAIPLTFRRNLLKREFFTRRLFMDYAHPIESVAGFSVSSADFEALSALHIFTDVLGALLGGEDREVTPGEEVLSCPKCPMRERGARPYLVPRNPEYEGIGFSDHNAVLCLGLMDSGRVSDAKIPCLSLLKPGVTCQLVFSRKEA